MVQMGIFLRIFTLICIRGAGATMCISEDRVFSLSLSLTEAMCSFIVLVGRVSVIILVYAKYYIHREFNLRYYILLIQRFSLRMLTLLSSNNILTIILSWEYLGVSRFFLINYYQRWERHNNSLVTLITIRVGEVFLLIIMRCVFMRRIITRTHFYRARWGISLLVVALTKRAQIPFRG